VVTAHPHALDADCILAGQAALLGSPSDVVTIATTNVRHFTAFPGIDAKVWDTNRIGMVSPGVVPGPPATGRPRRKL
jgi:hypothetical protein